MHICTVCFQPMDEHLSECDCGHRHIPPLCCPGCERESFEYAHRGLDAMTVRSKRLHRIVCEKMDKLLAEAEKSQT
jgi:hypothetical protein